MDKLLTISIAAYNVERYIRQTLESLCCEQILPDIEIIVVDDGSNDKTYDIAKQYEEKYPESFRVVHKKNGGWGSTVNYSIEHASGKYFKLLDGDDYFNSKGFIEFIEKLRNIDVDIVYSTYFRLDSVSGKVLQRFDADSSFPRNKILKLCNMDLSNFAMPSITFATKLLQNNNIRLMQHCFYTDSEFVVKGMAYASTVFLTDIPVYMYRVGRDGQSIDIKGVKKHYMDAIQVAKELIVFSDKHISSDSSEILTNYIKHSIIYGYRALILMKNRKELIDFDKEIKNSGKDWYQINDKMVNRLRKLNFSTVKFEAYLFQIRFVLARKIKKLVSNIREWEKK